MARHGTRSEYKRGCRCDSCVQANTQYQRDARERARNRASGRPPALAAVPDPPGSRKKSGVRQPADEGPSRQTTRTVVSGDCVAAVEAQLAGIAGIDEQPGLVAAVRGLARVIDTPGAVAQHPAAAGRLIEVLLKLTPPKSTGGNLSIAREMAQRSGT